MQRILLIGYLFFSFSVGILCAQESSNPKVILITLDGVRWQELFSGADPLLINNLQYVKDTTALKNQFWHNSTLERRAKLFPFLWTEASKMGQLHGNRKLGSTVNLTNKMWFSYPGYNEILTGKADDNRIHSNNKLPNPNKTILEITNQDARYKNKVAAFASWDVFPFIINEERSEVPVNAGFELATAQNLSDREKLLNEMQPKTPSPWSSVRLDVFTHHYALEYMKKNHLNLVYIAYGETDDFAHDGDYASYLKSANTADSFIKELWHFTQKDPYYKDNTTFIITTDHGRGTDPIESWTSHGKNVKNADEVWLIAFGKNVTPTGETNKKTKLYSTQITPTIAQILKLKNNLLPGKPLDLKK